MQCNETALMIYPMCALLSERRFLSQLENLQNVDDNLKLLTDPDRYKQRSFSVSEKTFIVFL